MKHAILLSFATVAATGIIAFTTHAQKADVDLKAYQEYLSSHKTVSASGLLSEHAAPLFARRNSAPTAEARYLDSISIKYQLTKDERELLDANGFVVTERLSGTSFGEMYDDVWQKDLPVFISTDAILHAVHMSYDEILKTTEFKLFIPTLETLLGNLHTKSLPALDAAYGNNPAMTPMLQDIDVYLTVARRLLLDQAISTYYPSSESVVKSLQQMIAAEHPCGYPLFSSTNRTIDCSQFTVRGHYTQDPALGRYFKSMIWLGRTELMLTKPTQQGPPEQTEEDIQRQTIDAYLLREALSKDDNLSLLKKIDDMIVFLVGESDNIQVEHLDMLKQETGFSTADELLRMDVVKRFQTNLATKPYAEQRINSQILMSDPMVPEQLKPPSAFLFLGQRFIIDSYIFWNVVYDRIIRDGVKITRMLPSSMDALFALGNDASAQLLVDELNRYHYAPNLGALRYLVDSYGEDFWSASLYNTWLHSIRALNAPKDLESMPPFMQTAAWWQQKMNTQLSSWAQLRHDNLLYAKQSYSGGTSCSYPEGYVEPFPDMYGRLALFAKHAHDRYSKLRGFEYVTSYFSRLETVMDTLRVIAGKELSGTPLGIQEIAFMKSMLSTVPICGKMFDGWYTRLFFGESVTDENYVIADVHTAPTDESGNMVGWVKHVSTGKINLGFIVAPSQNGGTTAYTGPMLSYHEQVSTNFKRFTDEEWKETLKQSDQPRPEWVNIYLADSKGNRRDPGPMLITSAVAVEATPARLSSTPILHASYPNPCTSGGSALISFTIPAAAHGFVSLEVFDVNGRKVASLVNRYVEQGTYVARWDARSASGKQMPTGTYFIKLTSGIFAVTQSLVLMK